MQKNKLHVLVKFVRVWTELLPHDFRDDRIMYFIRLLKRLCVDEDPEVINFDYNFTIIAES